MFSALWLIDLNGALKSDLYAGLPAANLLAMPLHL